MKLSIRLQMNADLVPAHAKLADIGCDHGYVSIYLAEHKCCNRILAMDVNDGPLEIAKRNIRQAKKEEQIECRKSDGLSSLNMGEVDTILIAGMGGMLICKILRQYPELLSEIQTLILQPQSDFATVRKCIHDLGFRIQKESTCLDEGKYYFAFRAVVGHEIIYTEEQNLFGCVDRAENKTCLKNYLLQEKEKKEQICRQLRQTDSKQTKERIWELEHILSLIEKTLTCL